MHWFRVVLKVHFRSNGKLLLLFFFHPTTTILSVTHAPRGVWKFRTIAHQRLYYWFRSQPPPPPGFISSPGTSTLPRSHSPPATAPGGSSFARRCSVSIFREHSPQRYDSLGNWKAPTVNVYKRIIEIGRSTVHYTYKRYPSVISSGRVAVAGQESTVSS